MHTKTGQATPEEIDTQHEVEAFLRDPANHHDAPTVDVIETHGNLVFLAGPYAWKIKRAVKFPYMDFSTRALRHAACRHELAVNARLAPQLYLGITPITREADGKLAFGGTGEPLEWAVKMQRFAQQDLLSARAAEGDIASSLAKAVADAVYASHETAEIAPGPGSDRIASVMTPLFAALAQCKSLSPADVAAVRSAADQRFEACRDLLDERAAQGHVRRCHGDLHCANIVLWHGTPLLYDAIEFDDALATIDTLYDTAFLLMDLERLGQKAAASMVLNRYLWRSNADLDIKGLRCLPLFLALRAAIRGLVMAERAEQVDAHGDEARKARDFLHRARAYLAPPKPRLVGIAGLSGTGKSTLAASIAQHLQDAPGALHLRSDLERKSLFRVAETDRLPPEAYTPEKTREVYDIIARKARLALAAGWSVVADAVSALPDERALLASLATETGARFDGLWLTAEPEILRSRIAARRNDASDATEAVLASQLSFDTGTLGPRWQTLDASGTMADTLARARVALCLPAPAEATDPR